MLKSKDVLQMENKLMESIDPTFFDVDQKGTEDDRQIYNAYSAVQDLRLYLQGKEDKPC